MVVGSRQVSLVGLSCLALLTLLAIVAPSATAMCDPDGQCVWPGPHCLDYDPPACRPPPCPATSGTNDYCCDTSGATPVTWCSFKVREAPDIRIRYLCSPGAGNKPDLRFVISGNAPVNPDPIFGIRQGAPWVPGYVDGDWGNIPLRATLSNSTWTQTLTNDGCNMNSPSSCMTTSGTSCTKAICATPDSKCVGTWARKLGNLALTLILHGDRSANGGSAHLEAE